MWFYVEAIRKKLPDEYYENPELILQHPYTQDYVNAVKKVIEQYNAGEISKEEYKKIRERISNRARSIGFKKDHLKIINETYDTGKIIQKTKDNFSDIRGALMTYRDIRNEKGPEYVKNESLMSEDPSFMGFYDALVRKNQHTDWRQLVDHFENKIKVFEENVGIKGRGSGSNRLVTSPSDPETIVSEFFKAYEYYGEDALNSKFLKNTIYKWIPNAVRGRMKMTWEDFKTSLGFQRFKRFLTNEEIAERYFTNSYNKYDDKLLQEALGVRGIHSSELEGLNDIPSMVDYLNKREIKNRKDEQRVNYQGIAAGVFHEKLRVFESFMKSHEEEIDPEDAALLHEAVYDTSIDLEEFYNMFRIQLGIDIEDIREKTKKPTYDVEDISEMEAYDRAPAYAFNIKRYKKKAFNLKEFKEAGYNWRQHEGRENWRNRERANSFEGISVGDCFETKMGLLEIVGIEVDDPSDPNSDVYLVFADSQGNLINQDKPYKLRGYEWNSIRPKESVI